MSSAQKAKWLAPGFLIVCVILLISAIGLNAAVSKFKLYFLKQAVPLKQELTSLPNQMGDWMQVSEDEPLDHQLQETLGTDKYVFRDYVNTKTLTSNDLTWLGVSASDSGKSPAEALSAFLADQGSQKRKQLTGLLQLHNPEAVMCMAVTYYTGKVDTVAHIPERCMTADGYQPREGIETLSWNMGPDRIGTKPGSNARLDVRFINFEDQTPAGRATRRVAYFFFANGQYESDPLSVRQTLEDLRLRHGFYSKVELTTIIPDHDKCAEVMSGFLRSVMPEVEKCYPDWNQVEHPGVK